MANNKGLIQFQVSKSAKKILEDFGKKHNISASLVAAVAAKTLQEHLNIKTPDGRTLKDVFEKKLQEKGNKMELRKKVTEPAYD